MRFYRVQWHDREDHVWRCLHYLIKAEALAHARRCRHRSDKDVVVFECEMDQDKHTFVAALNFAARFDYSQADFPGSSLEIAAFEPIED